MGGNNRNLDYSFKKSMLVSRNASTMITKNFEQDQFNAD